uniref:Ferritin/DPS domain-containing protein n=1 Tax=Zosterops lateralis melanops TaxID=1220523 RepID=A0A8D2PIX8_ZOSLA
VSLLWTHSNRLICFLTCLPRHELHLILKVYSSVGEYFDQSHVALPNISKFFLHQALEERKAAEALMKYQQERGGHYCSKTIQVRTLCQGMQFGLMKALELAMVQWKTMLRYFEELYALSVENADPHSASTIKKQFIGQTCPEGEAGSRTQETQCSITPPALHSIPSSSAESQLKI